MNAYNLTKQLVSIPSFVQENENEVQIGAYIATYLQQNSSLIVEQ